MQGTKVGSVHTRVESLTLEGQACLQTSSVQSLTINRFGEETTFQTAGRFDGYHGGTNSLVPFRNAAGPHSTDRSGGVS